MQILLVLLLAMFGCTHGAIVLQRIARDTLVVAEYPFSLKLDRWYAINLDVVRHPGSYPLGIFPIARYFPLRGESGSPGSLVLAYLVAPISISHPTVYQILRTHGGSLQRYSVYFERNGILSRTSDSWVELVG